jgi:PKD repeat protein
VTENEVILTVEQNIYCYDRDSGELLWSAHAPSYREKSPIIGYGKIVVPTYGIQEIMVFSSYPSNFPVADIRVSNNEILTLSEITIDASNSYDDELLDKYYFDFGDGNNTGWIENNSVKYTYSKSGIYTIQLKVIDIHRLESNFTEVSINIINRLPVLPAFKDKKIIEDELIYFENDLEDQIYDTDGNIIGFKIDYGDGQTIQDNKLRYREKSQSGDFYGVTVEHRYKSPGKYKVTFTVLDDSGGKNSTYFYVNVEPIGFFEKPINIILILMSIFILIILIIVIKIFFHIIKRENKKNK